MCNVPIQLSGNVLAAFLRDYGDVEDYTTIKSSSGTAHGDYSFTMCLNRGVFQAITHTLDYKDQAMVVVEGRKLQCWHCKEIGHFSKSCLQKTTNTTITTAQTTATTSLTLAKSSTVPSTMTSPATTSVSSAPTNKPEKIPPKKLGTTPITRMRRGGPR